MNKVKVIGAGLAGAEAAYYLARKGIKVELYDMKPNKYTPAHKSPNFSELVCSNSLKSNDVYGNAAGLLKQEMRILGSVTMAAADKTAVPAGGALAVDREKFSESVTETLLAQKNVEFISEEVKDISPDEYTIIATGPLTSEPLIKKLEDFAPDSLSFYDASAPIVSFESLEEGKFFFGDRYGKGNGDHVNCPMDKEEYDRFIDELLSAEKTELHEFEKTEIFEGCMPVEIMAARGKDTLRFGPLKPVGLYDPVTGKRPYACLQLRKENAEGTMYNLVGFQTNLKFGEQKRVFGIIPALKNAEYLRYGVMHRNTFINSPKALNPDYSFKNYPKVFLAGQITGVEGYVESAASGLAAAIYCERKINGKEPILAPSVTVMGSLARYITTDNKDFQPMNANFGILPMLNGVIKDKSKKKYALAERSLSAIKEFYKELEQ